MSIHTRAARQWSTQHYCGRNVRGTNQVQRRYRLVGAPAGVTIDPMSGEVSGQLLGQGKVPVVLIERTPYGEKRILGWIRNGGDYAQHRPKQVRAPRTARVVVSANGRPVRSR
ncbi:hypothetical protein HY375_02795 [Candidatus Berkelbacteria bacterium]|nr:hypothetical protein [Candidatus Berkelbacteria bacterium]